MSDVFHEAVPDEFIDRIFAVMALANQHQFQCLTKRPKRMLNHLKNLAKSIGPLEFVARQMGFTCRYGDISLLSWPIPNIWLGISCEDQETADERIPLLLQTPAAIRFVSYEPALAAVDFTRWLPRRCRCVEQFKSLDCPACHGTGIIRYPGAVYLDQIIIGGESGPNARPFDVAWARDIIVQCQAVEVACFVKQLGAHAITRVTGLGDLVALKYFHDRKGGDWEEWPDDLRVREFPKEESRR